MTPREELSLTIWLIVHMSPLERLAAHFARRALRARY